ncbi:MAG: AraC family transcriptional regulator [Butyribacter sp.]|nr:AraC family transcriptional regulator [bacterium]MDY3853361.1 AraC family transcriptional regulator [Butyribacter sp.]
MWFIYYPDLKDVEDLPFYTLSIGMHIWQYPTDRPQGYEYPQFLYSNQGCGRLTTEGKTIDIPEKSIIFLPANVPHSYEATTDVWDVRWFVPSGTGVPDLLKKFNFTKCKVFPVANLSSLDEIHNKIHMAFQINTKESLFFSASYTYEFLFEFYKQYMQCTNTTAVQYRKRLTPLIDYIEHHYAENLTQKTLCRQIGVSPQHLCRMIQQCLGTRPMEYLARTRISHACDFLVKTQKSIEDISYDVGFNNLNYFCKTFKKYTSMTPGNYRIANRTINTDSSL